VGVSLSPVSNEDKIILWNFDSEHSLVGVSLSSVSNVNKIIVWNCDSEHHLGY